MASTTDPVFVDAEPVTLAAIRAQVPMEDLAGFYDRVFGVVAGAIAASDAAIAAPAMGVYFGAPTDTADVAAGFPITGTLTQADEVQQIELPAARSARLLYTGPYEGLEAAFQIVQRFIADHGEQPGDVMWEQYLTEPTPTADPEDMQTLINWTIAAS